MTEPIELLQHIIDTLIHTTEHDTFTTYLNVTSTFLKTRYQQHALRSERNDNCCTHNLEYVLGRVSPYDKSAQTCDKVGVTCNQCRFPFYICNELKKSMNEQRNNSSSIDANFETKMSDAIDVVNECEKKFQLFMAHKARCCNQNRAIEKIHEKMKESCVKSKGKNIIATMIGDFKMKFEPLSARETTLDHYGKRGISWHGFCVEFYLLQEKEQEDGSFRTEPTKYTIYIDQILVDGNKQDSLSVFCLLEAAMAQISHELPFVSSIIVQTDNAKSYNNAFLLCAIPLLNAVFYPKGIAIVEFIHTETQDGKTILDAHFARMMKFVKRHLTDGAKVNHISRINTPMSLCMALSHNGGVRNVAIQLVRTNYVRPALIERKFDAVTAQLKHFFSRINHAYFYPRNTEDEGWKENGSVLKFIDTMSFKIGVQAFSNINRIIGFFIDMRLPNKDKVTPDDIMMKELNFQLKNKLTSNNTSEDTSMSESHTMIRHIADIEDNELHEVVKTLFDLRDGVEGDKSDLISKDTLDDESLSGESSYSDASDDDSSVFKDHDDELDDKYYEVESVLTRRELNTPDAELYKDSQFVSNVTIEMMLPFGKISTFDRLSKKQNRNMRKKVTNFVKKDVRTEAIRITNNLIQQGDVRITSAMNDDPILDESSTFDHTLILLPFPQGWGRRHNNPDSTLYGETYIRKYRSTLEKFFEQGEVDTSRKMNAAMMREELKKEYPNVYSLPGETEIKKFIGALSQSSKKKKKKANNSVENTNDDDTNTTLTTTSKDFWKKQLYYIVKANMSFKPDSIYNMFVGEMKKYTSVESLPEKSEVKKNISSLKTKLKKHLKRSIV